MKKPLVSIIVPGYNVENCIDRCFESLEKQTYSKIEVVLINDGSTDKTGELMKQFAQRHSNCVFVSQENAGLSEARNRGIEASSGEYITFLDSDDYLEPNAIEYLISNAVKHKCDISICPHFVDRDGILRDFNQAKLKSGVWMLEKAFDNMLDERGTNLQVASKLFARYLFDDNKFLKGRLHEDVGLVYRLFLDCKTDIYFGSHPMYGYVIRENSITNSGFSFKRANDLIEQTDLLCDAVDEKFPNLLKNTQMRRIHARFSVLRMVSVIKNKTQKESELEKEMVEYLKDHSGWMRDNVHANERDKLALLCLCLGRKFFAFAWGAYEKLAKR